MYRISRFSSAKVLTVAQSAALSGAMGYGDYAHGGLITPGTLSATTKIAFKVSEQENGTYVDLRNISNVLVEITVDVAASHAYPLPDELSGWPWFKIWCEASGSDVTQAAARTFIVAVKG